MVFIWLLEGDRVDMDKYEFYFDVGRYVFMCVWFVVLL